MARGSSVTSSEGSAPSFGAGRVLAGEVKIGVGRGAKVARVECRRPGLGPDPGVRLCTGERRVFLQRLRVLTPTVCVVAPALTVRGAAAGRTHRGGGEGP